MDHLTEPGIRDYFVESFKSCKEYKLQYHTWILNISLFILFMSCLGSILYYKYKGKQSPMVKKRKQEEDRVYIMNRIRSLQLEKQKENNQLITGLTF
jgi:hypothetical protein